VRRVHQSLVAGRSLRGSIDTSCSQRISVQSTTLKENVNLKPCPLTLWRT